MVFIGMNITVLKWECKIHETRPLWRYGFCWWFIVVTRGRNWIAKNCEKLNRSLLQKGENVSATTFDFTSALWKSVENVPENAIVFKCNLIWCMLELVLPRRHWANGINWFQFKSFLRVVSKWFGLPFYQKGCWCKGMWVGTKGSTEMTYLWSSGRYWI